MLKSLNFDVFKQNHIVAWQLDVES